MLYLSSVSLHSVDLSSLGPLLSQIVVALYPWVNKFPDVITAIFTYLIIEHKLDMLMLFCIVPWVCFSIIVS